jgi:LAS superfamily LD-carboxypeptidase LdcB
MSQYHAATAGSPLCVTDSYRSYAEQVDVYQRKPGLAAVPGTSNHGWGQAVDFCGGIQTAGSAAYRWMEANAGRFGWVHPEWARPAGSKPEAWHWEFQG